MDAVIIFAVLSILLVAGKIIRLKMPLLQKLYLPSSVIGGVVGLVIFSVFPGALPEELVAQMRRMPGFLINVIFATLFLGDIIDEHYGIQCARNSNVEGSRAYGCHKGSILNARD